MQTTKKNSLKMDITNSAFLLGTPLLAIITLILHYKYESPVGMLWFWGVLLYFLIGMSITMGYHRLISHKSYEAHPILKFFLLIFGAAAFENSALKWGSDHRVHHTHCDRELDPYNINKGFMWAHMGWVMFKEPSKFKEEFPMSKDMLKDPMIMWQHKYYLLISITVGIILPILIGFAYGAPIGGLAIVGFARIVFLHHCTFFINSLCHYLGSQPYTDTNTARDHWFTAIFTFGEGYHNFHHFFQADYRNGVRWYHIDPGKWFILLSEKLGLAWKLKRVPDEDILRAKLLMKQKSEKCDLNRNDYYQKFQVLFEKLKEMRSAKVDPKLLGQYLKELRLNYELTMQTA